MEYWLKIGCVVDTVVIIKRIGKIKKNLIPDYLSSLLKLK